MIKKISKEHAAVYCSCQEHLDRVLVVMKSLVCYEGTPKYDQTKPYCSLYKLGEFLSREDIVRLEYTTYSVQTIENAIVSPKITVVPTTNQVNHPQHYGGAEHPFEPIKIIEGLNLDFHIGNTLKYMLRAGKKNPEKEVEDLEKAVWYLQRKIQKLKKSDENKTTGIN